jgi:hypothetical protein
VGDIAITADENADRFAKLDSGGKVEYVLRHSVGKESSLAFSKLRCTICIILDRGESYTRESTTLILEWRSHGWRSSGRFKRRKYCLGYGTRSRIGRTRTERPRARWRKELHNVEHELVQVTRDQLIDLIEDKETHFRADEASRRSKERVEFLRSSAYDMRHVLLKKTQLLAKITAGRSGADTQSRPDTDRAS